MQEHKITCEVTTDQVKMSLDGKGNTAQGRGSGNMIVCLGLVGVSIAISASVWYPIQTLSAEIRSIARIADRKVDTRITGEKSLKLLPQDCYDVRNNGNTVSGIYTIFPGSTRRGFPVYCDMDTDEGGWTVFQRRVDGTVDFKADWKSYQFGFGNLSAEFWLGNEFLHLITYQAWYELYIVLEDFDGDHRYAKYRLFNVEGRDNDFKLTLGGYSGDAGDSFSTHNGLKFSTTDRDNDLSPGSCADAFKGGWWYSNCLNACLNGQYHVGEHETKADGINWFHWRGYNYSLKKTQMMIRPL